MVVYYFIIFPAVCLIAINLSQPDVLVLALTDDLSINLTSGGLTGCFQAVGIFVCSKKGQVVKGILT